MKNNAVKKGPWVKRFLVAGLALVLILAVVYWFAATDTFSDTKDRKAVYTVSAMDFLREFQKDDSLANKKYRDKIVSLTGRISDLEAPDTSTVNVKFIDTTTGNYIIFRFQEQHLQEARLLQKGDSISVKGACNGVEHSNILEVSYITFIRAALNK